MAVLEEYLLEIEFERDDEATRPSAPSKRSRADRPTRTEALRDRVAGRMRAAPLVVLFVASVVGFTALQGLLTALVAAFENPDLFLSPPLQGFGGSIGWVIIVQMVLAALTGTAGALLVFRWRMIGWTCLVAFALWQVIGPYVMFRILVSQLGVPAETVPSFWELQDAASWTLMTVRFVLLALLFVPHVLSWVVAPGRGRLASPGSFTAAPAPAPRSPSW